jgi:prepilin-type N-terminal cleavage/methylation domain-containing protein
VTVLAAFRRRLDRLRAEGDAGFTLIEAMAALVIFAILSGAVFTLLNGALGVSRDNRLRVKAAALAERQMGIARAMPYKDVKSTDKATVTVDKDVFQIVQTIQPVPQVNVAANGSSCDATATGIAYKRVTIVVTWPAMRSVKPVRNETLISVPVGTQEGALAVPVVDAKNQPLAGVPVVLDDTGATVLTSEAGCAVFTDLPAPKAYQAHVAVPGYVNPAGANLVTTTSTNVEPGKISKTDVIQYDKAASIAVSFDSPADHPYDPKTPVAMVTDGTSPLLLRECGTTGAAPAPRCVTGYPRSTSGVFPTDLTYRVWAGECADAQIPGRESLVELTNDGSTKAVTVKLGSVDVTVTRSNSTAAPTTLYAYHPGDSSCAGATVTLGTVSGAGGTLKASLPFGAWTVTTDPTGATPGKTGFTSAPDAPALASVAL